MAISEKANEFSSFSKALSLDVRPSNWKKFFVVFFKLERNFEAAGSPNSLSCSVKETKDGVLKTIF